MISMLSSLHWRGTLQIMQTLLKNRAIVCHTVGSTRTLYTLKNNNVIGAFSMTRLFERKKLTSCPVPIFFQNTWKASCLCIHTDTQKLTNEKSLALVHVLKEIKTSPAPALVLGLSGLIPFVSIPCYFLYAGTFIPQLAFAQLAYGASILSFLGGVRWGFTLPESVSHELTWKNLGWSVIPSLLAWSSLLMPYSFGTLTAIAGIGGAAYLDLMYQAYPTWFKALRFCLSLIAVLSLWTSLVLSFTLS